MATTKSFDERLHKIRYDKPELATAQFSRDEVVAYIAAEHAWGSGGVANGFWCDACRISAWSWDCT